MQQLRALTAGADLGTWVLDGDPKQATIWKRCKDFDSPAVCNWLVQADEDETLYRSCLLNHTISNLDDPDNRQLWRKK